MGYNKLTLQPGFNMLGVQFKAVGGVGNTIDIQETVKPVGLVGFDWEMGEGGDTLLIWDPTAQGYVETYIWAGTEDTSEILGYDISGTWFNGETLESADKVLTVGNAFWIKSASGATATMSGEVASSESSFTANVTPGGFTMIANPYPTALDINSDMTVTGLVGFDWEMGEGGDTLLIWDPTAQGYVETYIWAGTEDTSEILGYDISGTWFNGETLESATATVPVGGAMWIKTSGSGGTITFRNPL